jgi:hypothetical protein
VVLWEIATPGGFPYPSTTNEEVLEYLLQGKRLNQPPGCANEIYDIMMRCWERSPGERLSFSELQQRFAGMLLEEVDYMELSGLTEGLPPGTRVGQPAVARAVSTVLADQGRYDQLMVAPPTGNPYVLSPHPSSVPSPRNSSLLSERYARSIVLSLSTYITTVVLIAKFVPRLLLWTCSLL